MEEKEKPKNWIFMLLHITAIFSGGIFLLVTIPLHLMYLRSFEKKA